jgi:glycosyltransferase involved in cell wall biosynthesis
VSRVTIGLPVFNGESYLAGALAALSAQTYSDFEVIVADNASTDGTRAICEAAAARDPRITYVRHPENLGAAPNFNFVFGRAGGEYFKWAAHDDVCAPEYLSRCVEALDRAGKRAVLAFPRTRFVDARGESLGVYDQEVPWDGGTPSSRARSLLADPKRSHLHKCLPVCGLMRTSALRRTRLIGSFVSSDAALLFELALLGDWVEVPEVLFDRRVHAQSSRANRTDAQIARWFDSRSGKRFPLPRTRLLASYASALARTPLAAGERLRCAAPVARRARDEWRVIAGELRIGARERIAERLNVRRIQPTK